MNKQKKKSKKINRCDKNTNNYSEHEKSLLIISLIKAQIKLLNFVLLVLPIT